MTMELLRLATVGAFMFGGGVVAADIVLPTTPGLPLSGTECASSHCAPTPYRPRPVANEKDVFTERCPPRVTIRLAGYPGNVGHGGVVMGPIMRTEDAALASVKAPLFLTDAALLSDATPSPGTLDLDTYLAETNRSEVVSTAAAGGSSSVVFVLYKCSTKGLVEQFVRVPVDPTGQTTLETIIVDRPQQR